MKHRWPLVSCLTGIVLVTVNTLNAAPVWDGGASGNWEVNTNWNDGGGDPAYYPGHPSDATTGDVTITNSGAVVTLGGGGSPVAVNLSASGRNLYVQSGASLTVNAGSSIAGGNNYFYINAKENATHETLFTVNGLIDLRTPYYAGNVHIGNSGDTDARDGVGEGARLLIPSGGVMSNYYTRLGHGYSGLSAATLEVNGGLVYTHVSVYILTGRPTGTQNPGAIAPARVITISGATTFEAGSLYWYEKPSANNNVDFDLNIIGSTAKKIQFNAINLTRSALPAAGNVHQCSINFIADANGFNTVTVTSALTITNDFNDISVDLGSFAGTKATNCVLFTVGSRSGTFRDLQVLNPGKYTAGLIYNANSVVLAVVPKPPGTLITIR